MVLQTREFQFGAFLYRFKILFGMNQGVTGSNSLATSQFANKSCLFWYCKHWRSLQFANCSLKELCKLVITYRKGLVFNNISSMCRKGWNGKGTEESMGKKLVVQQREGVYLPSVFLARHSRWCAETHNLNKFMRNNFELWQANPMIFWTHLVPEVICVFIFFYNNIV